MCVSLKPTSSDLCTISCVWVSLKDVGVTSDVRYLSLSRARALLPVDWRGLPWWRESLVAIEVLIWYRG